MPVNTLGYLTAGIARKGLARSTHLEGGGDAICFVMTMGTASDKRGRYPWIAD
jgi:hypothetical protein